MRLRPPEGKKTVTAEDLDAIMNPSRRAKALKHLLGNVSDNIHPLIELYRPYVDGLTNLPRDGRFLLVGNHTQTFLEVYLTSYYLRRELGVRVRPLAERGMGEARGLAKDVIAAYGGVVGHPDTARELMRHNQTVLVFPGGGREIAKFKGEEYQLRWEGRSGFARVAIDNDYPIVPVGLVGGDDVYQSLFARDSRWGKLSQSLSERLSGRTDMAMPLMRGVGPTLIPRPQRMYLAFGEPIDTTRPGSASAASWVETVRENTRRSLQEILADLQAIRADDPFRNLNPLAWPSAVQPAHLKPVGKNHDSTEERQPHRG
ncbi:lysophospholipid acyltransferase family protein [Mycobacterium cookii]|uniref:Membrane protein n=1 Tax=Mycobacterium cookii TaxID=1775 RepID=A0A7I7KVW3_9MYCO|nr:lysophospholipid acyltransferase family protein [Mycobacterium cookii]MCV7332814.1 acyltransferase family protein [Mycobacterium cookii]BBX46200.1 membrane protein [Mycobacterium cookii]